MAAYRAVENGFLVMRQTDHGLSIAVDPYGRVLAELDHYATTDRTMTAQLLARALPAVYNTVGDLLGALALFGFGVVLVWRIVAGKRRRDVGSKSIGSI